MNGPCFGMPSEAGGSCLELAQPRPPPPAPRSSRGCLRCNAWSRTSAVLVHWPTDFMTEVKLTTNHNITRPMSTQHLHARCCYESLILLACRQVSQVLGCIPKWRAMAELATDSLRGKYEVGELLGEGDLVSLVTLTLSVHVTTSCGCAWLCLSVRLQWLRLRLQATQCQRSFGCQGQPMTWKWWQLWAWVRCCHLLFFVSSVSLHWHIAKWHHFLLT